jgi:hypothetical protein
MATKTWTSGSDWSTATWTGGVPVAGDDVVLNRGGSHTFTLDVDTPSLKSLSFGSSGGGDTLDVGAHTLNVNYAGSTGISLNGGDITIEGGTINDTSNLSTTGSSNTGNISGYGTLNVGGSISGSGTLTASGGTLDVFGTIDSGIGFVIGTSTGSTLKIEGTATASSAITINNSHQTLEIGASGALTINARESITSGTIKLDGGSLTTSGLTLGSGSLTGYGTVTGSLNGGSPGAGSVTASGGTLEFKSAVDGSSHTPATNFSISAGATLKFDNAVGVTGSGAVSPQISFTSATGTLDLSNISSETSNFHGTITGFESGDQIKFADSGSGTLSYTTSFSGGVTTVTVKDQGTTVGTVALNGNYTAAHFALSETGHIDTLKTDAACFMAGTMIATPDGEVAIETLKRGDLVLSSDGHVKPVSWLGVQTVSTRFADKMRVWPIRIKAEALGDNVPSRDLLLSPDHAVLVDGALVQAGALVNGTSIVRETNVPEVFTYYHVEVDDHSLILAENTPAETFVDNVDRLGFDNWAEHDALYPDGKHVEELPYPRAKSHRQVPVSIRAMLGARARAIGAVEGSAVA